MVSAGGVGGSSSSTGERMGGGGGREEEGVGNAIYNSRRFLLDLAVMINEIGIIN